MQAKLLFIDDDVDTCDVVDATLTRHGFDVVCAQTGAAALALLEHDEFDAVISDLDLPGMSGLELCKRLRRSRPSLPLVLVTGFRGTETAREALRAGAFDVISKPTQIPELLATLARAIEQRPA